MSGVRLFGALAVIVASLTALLLAGCGGSGQKAAVGPGMQASLPELRESAPASVEQVLAELDAFPTPEGVDAELFQELKDALKEELTENRPGSPARLLASPEEQDGRSMLGPYKFASAPPAGETNKVTDLAVLDNGDGTFDVTWRYRNAGDYDQNGSVGISDITPIAMHYGEEATSSNEWIDGDDGDTIDIGDITPIAMNFGVQCAGYVIESCGTAEGDFTPEHTEDFGNAAGEGRLEFRTPLTLTVGDWVRVVPIDGAGDRGDPSDPEEVIEWWDDFTYDVTYSSETTYIDEENLDLLQDYDTETHSYTFDAQGVAAAGLDISPGRILLIHGVALETVVDARTVGDDLIVEGENAYLTDAITDGTIAWDYGVNFTADKIPSMLIDGKVICADENGVIEYEFPWGDYTYAIKVELRDAYAAMEFTISKDIGGGLGAKLVLEGNIERFRVNDLMEIHGSQLTSFDHTYEKMQGQGSISLVAAGSMEDTMTLVDLPAPLLIVPFAVGPVPVVLTIEAKFLVEVIVPPIDGSSRVTVSFSYDSDLGFSYDGISVHNTGTLGSHSFNDEVTETGGSSALGVNFGVAFPRIKLSAFWGKIVPWAHIQFVIGGTWDPIAPCQTADYEIRGVGDVDFTLFKLSDVVGDLTFFQQTEELLRAGD